MTSQQPFAAIAVHYARPLRRYWWLWITPTVCLTLLAGAYAIWGPKTWLASQQLVVRNESLGTQMNLGRFESYDVMKTVEETIHAVAKNRHVAEAVLREAGPPDDERQPASWPSPEAVDGLLESISLTAPNGAVFGQTEVIHLNVKASSPRRSVQLANTLCDQMETQLNQLRLDRSVGMEEDLQHAVTLAEQELTEVTRELATIERDLGPDLSELRTLDQQVSGGTGSLALELGRTRENLQEARRQAAAIELRRQHLQKIQLDPNAIVSVPTSIFTAHASLGRLKNGLVDVELALAKVRSKYDDTHPRVMRVLTEVKQIQRRLNQEVSIALDEVDFDARAMQDRANNLQAVSDQLSQRISRLSDIRVDYNGLNARVEQRKSDLSLASSQLAEVAAGRRAAMTTSIINRIGEPVVSTNPIGPSKKIVVVGGAFAGMAIGIGLVFLLVPPAPIGPDRRSVLPESQAATSQSKGRENAAAMHSDKLRKTVHEHDSEIENDDHVGHDEIGESLTFESTDAYQPYENWMTTSAAITPVRRDPADDEFVEAGLPSIDEPEPDQSPDGRREAKILPQRRGAATKSEDDFLAPFTHHTTVVPVRAGQLGESNPKATQTSQSSPPSESPLATDEERLRPRRADESCIGDSTDADIIHDLHELREQMRRG